MSGRSQSNSTATGGTHPSSGQLPEATSTATHMAPSPTTTGEKVQAVAAHFPDGFLPVYLIKCWPAGVPAEHQAAASKIMADAVAEARAAMAPTDPVAAEAFAAAGAEHQAPPPSGVTTGSQHA